MKDKKLIHLVLTHHWFDEIISGRKLVEYRALKKCHIKNILHNKYLETIVFHRGYSSVIVTRTVSNVDVGPCPYPDWPGDYIRIHFKSPIHDTCTPYF
jgi:hypothetical protein